MTNRKIIATEGQALLPYDLEGPVQPDMAWLPLNFDRALGQGCYLMRMEPGAKTIAHDHRGFEDFLILDGELIDDDGTAFRRGDFVSFKPDTRHHSWTKTGCLILVFEWRPVSKAL